VQIFTNEYESSILCISHYEILFHRMKQKESIHRLWYAIPEQFLEDLATRQGRSLLHELDEEELQKLLAFMRTKLKQEHGNPVIIEKDRWTLWTARKEKA
jgi:hypothetical protein